MKNIAKVTLASILGLVALSSASYASHHEKKHHEKAGHEKMEHSKKMEDSEKSTNVKK